MSKKNVSGLEHHTSAIALWKETAFGRTKMSIHGYRLDLHGLFYDLFKRDKVSASLASSALCMLRKPKKVTGRLMHEYVREYDSTHFPSEGRKGSSYSDGFVMWLVERLESK